MRAFSAVASLLLLVTISACPTNRRAIPTGPDPLTHPPLSPPPKLGPALEPPHFVLLRADARLHRFAHTGARPGHAEPDPHAHAHAPGAVSVYRLVADHGAWLEVESLPGWAGPAHCHDADARMVGLRLRIFVHRRDVAELTLTPVTQHYPDGTSLRLAAGAGLSPPLSFAAPKGERIRHLELEGLALNAEIPETSVGSAYAPAPLPDAENATLETETLHLPVGTQLHFGLGAKVRVDRAREAGVVGTASGQRRLRSSSTCLELVALLGAEGLPPTEPRTPPTDAREDDPAPGPAATVAPGTLLFWPGGKLAGVAAHMAGFERTVAPDGARTCLSRSVLIWRGGAADGKRPSPLRLCVKPSAVLDAESIPD